MGFSSSAQNALNRIINQVGTQVRIRYFTVTPGSVWDDEVSLTQSGNSLWTSGIFLPLNAREGSNESVLLNQGKLINSDSRLYVNGSLSFNGSTFMCDIQIGSPTGDLYTTIPLGGIHYKAESNSIYKKQYIRRLTGSLTQW